MKFITRVCRDLLRSESATIELEAVDDDDAKRLAKLAATADGPELSWDDDHIDEVQNVEVFVRRSFVGGRKTKFQVVARLWTSYGPVTANCRHIVENTHKIVKVTRRAFAYT